MQCKIMKNAFQYFSHHYVILGFKKQCARAENPREL